MLKITSIKCLKCLKEPSELYQMEIQFWHCGFYTVAKGPVFLSPVFLINRGPAVFTRTYHL